MSSIINFDKKAGQLTFNKYILYFVLMAALLGYGVVPKIWYACTCKKTTGVIKYFEQRKYNSRGGIKYNEYPLVDFVVDGNTYEFYGNRYQRDNLYAGDTVKVIYDPAFKRNAYINTFVGFWAPEVVYVIPISLILFLVFGLDSIPKKIKIEF